MNITVLGGGHGSYAAAADMSLQGHRVTLWRRDAAALKPLQEHPVLTLIAGGQEREARIAVVTADIREALRHAELILIPLPAIAQSDLAVLMAPHLRDGQVVYLTPGTFGSYVMAESVRRLGCTARVAFAETGTLPYLTRKHGPSRISLTTTATNLPTGVYPANATEHALAIIRQAYPSAHPIEDALSAALMNAGPIIHPPLIMMNAGPLDRSRDFDIHNEGSQPAVLRVTEKLDGERIALREALGYAPNHYPLRDHYEGRDWMYGPKSHSGVVESGNWREPIVLTSHRYMREDVEMGLAFLSSVADWLAVDAPVAHGLLAIAGAVCGQDFRTGDRTLPALGLAALTRGQVADLLYDGHR